MTAFPLLPRKKNSDKRRYGHVLVVAGSRGMTGAAVLAARAAIRSGSGLVTVAMPKSLIAGALKSLPEAMQLALSETKKGSASFSASSQILRFIGQRKVNSLLIGPGLSHNSQTQRLVKKLVHLAKIPMVLDADGLSLQKHSAPLVMTPHRREFERLFSKNWPEHRADRIKLAKRLSRFYDVVLVLKGHRTLVVETDKVFVNSTGNPGMAKGGSGDVLAGIIASFVAQGLEGFEAAKWAVYFHGLAGDLAAKKKSELGVLASDLIEFLPKAFLKKSLLV